MTKREAASSARSSATWWEGLGHVAAIVPRSVYVTPDSVSTYSELGKAVAELTGGAISLTASYAAAIAKVAGDSSSAAMATGLARSTGLVFANVIAGIEIIHGVAVLLDPHATPQEKVDGAVGASSGAACFIGSRLAAPRLASRRRAQSSWRTLSPS